MKRILVTQRVVVEGPGAERRDALDQAWYAFLAACDLLPLAVPNHLATADRITATTSWDGVLLTGGGDLERYGGDAPERDAVERLLVERALGTGRPVLGVCRGMQFLLDRAGQSLVATPGHVAVHHAIEGEREARTVNSYHELGCRDVPPAFAVVARAADGVVEAVRHREQALVGVMWHPERSVPAQPADVALFRSHFACEPLRERGT